MHVMGMEMNDTKSLGRYFNKRISIPEHSIWCLFIFGEIHCNRWSVWGCME